MYLAGLHVYVGQHFLQIKPSTSCMPQRRLQNYCKAVNNATATRIRRQLFIPNNCIFNSRGTVLVFISTWGVQNSNQFTSFPSAWSHHVQFSLGLLPEESLVN